MDTNRPNAAALDLECADWSALLAGDLSPLGGLEPGMFSGR